MRHKLQVVADWRGGWFSRADALCCGYTDSDIRTFVRTGAWTRLCRGAFMLAEPDGDQALWQTQLERYIRMSQAVYHRLGGRAVLSHQSALAVLGVPVSLLDLSRVHVTRFSGHGRTTPEVVQHVGVPPVREVLTIRGAEVMPMARAVVEAIRFARYPVAVSVVDAALHSSRTTSAELADALTLFASRTGIRTAERAVHFAEARTESVGESLLRVVIAEHGLPPPVPQAEIHDSEGQLVGRVDFLFADWRVVVEFDGEAKYRGTDGAEAVVAEKWREDRLRGLGYQVVRVAWRDLDHPAEIVARINRAKALARASPGVVPAAAGAG
ncbi:type IV toxin-antitoxin system AbiEi family antitoxin domain-containing protein [Kribbella deserti]|uniref:Type IV toxin-antitoxin system AbiEi family antitoxin domain-containing protein n=1 Tax=Kribbella deserti TaxID=1926257 RepID=A0ABV6QL27_9ACTN